MPKMFQSGELKMKKITLEWATKIRKEAQIFKKGFNTAVELTEMTEKSKKKWKNIPDLGFKNLLEYAEEEEQKVNKLWKEQTTKGDKK